MRRIGWIAVIISLAIVCGLVMRDIDTHAKVGNELRTEESIQQPRAVDAHAVNQK